MKDQIMRLAEKYFGIGTKSGLITGDTVGNLLSDKDVREIEEGLIREKKSFIDSGEGLQNAESLWAEGVETRVNHKLLEVLKERAMENNRGFELDWKFSLEDLVSNLKRVLPDMDIQARGEVQSEGDWREGVMINGREYSFSQQGESRVAEILRVINEELLDTEKEFVLFDTGGDSYGFLLSSKEGAEELKRVVS